MFRNTDGNMASKLVAKLTKTKQIIGSWFSVLVVNFASLERIFYKLLCSELLLWVLLFLCKLHCAASCAQQLVTPSGAVGRERKRRPEFDVVPCERTCQIKSVSGSRQAKWSVRLDLKRYASSVSHRR